MDDFETRAQRVRELAELGDEITKLAGHLSRCWYMNGVSDRIQ